MVNKKRERQWTHEETENFVEFINALRKAEEEQKHMTEEEKLDNAIKMRTEKGDIYY